MSGKGFQFLPEGFAQNIKEIIVICPVVRNEAHRAFGFPADFKTVPVGDDPVLFPMKEQKRDRFGSKVIRIGEPVPGEGKGENDLNGRGKRRTQHQPRDRVICRQK